jgi:hypothetical protein
MTRPLKKKPTSRHNLLTWLPLATGALIYLNCRASSLYYERLLRPLSFLHWSNTKAALNETCRTTIGPGVVYQVIVFSLPYALWTFSLCLFIETRLGSRDRQILLVRHGVYLLLVITNDFLQLVGRIPGTFDLMDIALASTAVVLASISSHNPRR